MTANKHKMKFVLLTIIFVYIIGINANVIFAKDFYIYVLKNKDIKPYEVALKGCVDELHEKGYREGKNIILKYYEENDPGFFNVVNEIKDKKPDLILTFGTKATKLVKKEIKDTNVVFSMVLNPIDSGIVDNMNVPGGNVTGAAMDISSLSYFKILKESFPSVKRIGIIYDPKNVKSVVDEADKSARELNLRLVRAAVSSSKEVPDAIAGIVKEIDVLWVIADVSVLTANSLDYILKISLQKKIPVVAYTSYVVKIGALFSLDADFEDIGRQTGELVVKVLEGKKAGSLGVTVPRKTGVTINRKVAGYLGLNIPSNLLKKAANIIE